MKKTYKIANSSFYSVFFLPQTGKIARSDNCRIPNPIGLIMRYEEDSLVFGVALEGAVRVSRV